MYMKHHQRWCVCADEMARFATKTKLVLLSQGTRNTAVKLFPHQHRADCYWSTIPRDWWPQYLLSVTFHSVYFKMKPLEARLAEIEGLCTFAQAGTTRTQCWLETPGSLYDPHSVTIWYPVLIAVFGSSSTDYVNTPIYILGAFNLSS